MLRLAEDLVFQLRSAGAAFLETRGDDNGSWHASLHALADHIRNGRRRRGDDGEINFLRDRGDVWKCLNAQHAGALRIDGINSALKRAQIFQQRTSDTARLFRGADDGDGLRTGSGC